MTLRKTILVGLMIALSPTMALAQQQCLHAANESALEKERSQLALGVVRLINSAQVRYYREFGRYASWEQLVASPILKTFEGSNPAGSVGRAYRAISTAPNTDILPNFELRLTTDGKTYSLLLRDNNDPCKFSLYSDQVGVIYYGQPIDRPASVSPGEKKVN